MDTVMELEITSGSSPGSYTVHVLRSVGGGEPSGSITLDVEGLLARRSLLEATVLASSVSARRVMSDKEAAIQDVGVRLFDTVFAGDVGVAYRTSSAIAAERGRDLQLVLRLNGPGLAALPWETLYDAETAAYLARREPLVRRVAAPYSPDALDVVPPLRILGLVAAPRGLHGLDVDAEHRRLEEALSENLRAGLVELVWLDDASWAGVQSILLKQPWHILHFIGHGGYDAETDEGVLALVGSDGRPDYVPASSLADLFKEASPTPRLVVLNACQSGAASTTDLFSGTAAALVHSGIHAVAAMQFAISDIGAIAFARGFYTALAHGRGIEEAVRSGRIGILGIGRGTLEWVTPVLYLRGDDTHIFAVEPLRGVGTTPQREKARGETAADSGGSSFAKPYRARLRRVSIAAAAGAAAIVSALVVIAALQQFVRPSGAPETPTPVSTPKPATPTPAELAVPANQAWTRTGIRCSSGESLKIVASGTVLHERPPTTPVGPDGLQDPAYHQWNVEGLPDANTVALIGSLDASQPYFVVGNGLTYECPRGGELFLGINDIGLDGNSGQFSASVTRTPAG